MFRIISFLINSSKCLDLVTTYAEISLLDLRAILLCLTLALGLDVKLEAYIDVFDIIYDSHIVYQFTTGDRLLLIFLQLMTLQVNS